MAGMREGSSRDRSGSLVRSPAAPSVPRNITRFRIPTWMPQAQGSQEGRKIQSSRYPASYTSSTYVLKPAHKPPDVTKIVLRNVNSGFGSNNGFVRAASLRRYIHVCAQIRDLEARVEILSGGQDEAISEMRNILKG
jgi:hypothetical protein